MNSGQRINLLAEVLHDRLTRSFKYRQWLTKKTWERYVELQRAGRAPASLYDLQV